MTTVLVTGGAGFVGSHTVDRLVNEGYDVTVLDNLTDQVHDQKPAYLNDDAEYVWGDIRDQDLVRELLESADVLSHQASAVGVGQSMYEIEHYVEVNTFATATMLETIVNEGIELEKIVVASSMSIYGEGEYYCSDCDTVRYPALRPKEQLTSGDWEHRCPDDDTPLDPRPTPESKPRESTSVYAITKKDQEELVLSVARAYDIPAVALRYFNIYGSRQSLDNPYTGVCAIFSSRLKNNNPPLIFEDGRQTRDFIHVSDVARANQAAIETEAANGAAINIGRGSPVTVNEIADILIEFYGKRGEIEPEITNDFRAGDIRHCFADISKARDLLDFEPEVKFRDGMEELVEWAQAQEATDNFDVAHSELETKGLVGED